MKKLFLKSLILTAGLFVLALGVALSVRSDLGVSPSASLSFLVAEIFPLSMGNVSILVNIIYVLIQVVLLGKQFRLMNLLQLFTVFLFGYFTDLALFLTKDIVCGPYLAKMLLCVFSCALMGLGLYLEINADLLTMASEGAIALIANRTRKDFGFIKIVNDVLFVIASLILSLLYFHRIEGIGAGTLLSAFLVGYFSQLYSRFLPWFKKKEEETGIFAFNEKYPLVITIERELGSGGHEIAKRLAKDFGLYFYDYELIQEAAKLTGLDHEAIEKKEERVSLLYSLYDQSYGYTRQQSDQDKIFAAQKTIIRHIADLENCVIVGRLGAYILKDRPNTFNIFISGDRKYRVNELLKKQPMDKKAMEKIVEKEDELRKAYCRHFTGRSWGLARHYHLCIDSSVYGADAAYELVKNAVTEFVKRTSNELNSTGPESE